MRNLPSIQKQDSPQEIQISPAAHIFSQFNGENAYDYYKEIYRAVCMTIWSNDRVANAVDKFVEEYIGHGGYNDPILQQLMLFFKRNEAELEGIQLGHIIEYHVLAQLQILKDKADAWVSSGIKPYSQYENDEFVYVFEEICTQQQLIVEGRVMQHDVASYIDGCMVQQYSIWSLR